MFYLFFFLLNFIGAALGEKCGSTYPPCLNANAVCLKGLISLSPPKCQCEKGYINANNQCLIQTNYKRFGEWCGKECGLTLSCKLGFCQCQPGYRQRTALEIQADPNYEYDCIENEFSLCKLTSFFSGFYKYVFPQLLPYEQDTTQDQFSSWFRFRHFLLLEWLPYQI